MSETTHACPPIGDWVTPCCGKSPFDLPRTDRITRDADAVTCGKPAPPEEPAVVASGVMHVASGGPGVLGMHVTDDGTPYFNRNEIALLVPEEEAAMFGHVNPTRAMVAQARAEIEPRYAHEVEAWTQTRAFLAQVEATEFPALAGDLLELHARTEHGDCETCGDERSVEWPCATARLALAHAGIEVPDNLMYDTPVLPVDDGTNPFWPYPMGPLQMRDIFPFVTMAPDPITFGNPT